MSTFLSSSFIVSIHSHWLIRPTACPPTRLPACPPSSWINSTAKLKLNWISGNEVFLHSILWYHHLNSTSDSISTRLSHHPCLIVNSCLGPNRLSFWGPICRTQSLTVFKWFTTNCGELRVGWPHETMKWMIWSGRVWRRRPARYGHRSPASWSFN